MIAIQVDETACVSCTLCVEACATRVFGFDETRGLPIIENVSECFGCLACAYACPANAIEHDGVAPSLNFYHDPHSIEMLSKMTGDAADVGLRPFTDADVKKGLHDLGARLVSLAAVLKATLRSGLPAVGTFAGRTLAGQLPRYRLPANLDETLDLAKSEFAPAWQLDPKIDGNNLAITVKDCFLRDLCGKQELPLGGDLCMLFYYYLTGYLNRMGKVRLRLSETKCGQDACEYRAQIYS